MRGTKVLAGAPVVTSPRHRVCARPGCHTRLSVYNHGRYCIVHEEIETDLFLQAGKCTCCGEVKPLDEEHWHHDFKKNGGWGSVCRECRNRIGRQRYRRKRGVKRCRQCGKDLPWTDDHWSFGANGRTVHPCLDCQCENRKERAKRALESHYRRKYGMSRAEYRGEVLSL